MNEDSLNNKKSKDVEIEFFTPEDKLKKEKEQKEKEKELFWVVISQNKGKIASLSLAILYLIFASIGGGELFFRVLAFLILPIALIWFSDNFGRLIGAPVNSITGFPGNTEESVPGIIIKVIGWIILLLPIIQSIIVILLKK